MEAISGKGIRIYQGVQKIQEIGIDVLRAWIGDAVNHLGEDVLSVWQIDDRGRFSGL